MSKTKTLVARVLADATAALTLLEDPYLRPDSWRTDEEVAMQRAAAVELERACRAIAKLLVECP